MERDHAGGSAKRKLPFLLLGRRGGGLSCLSLGHALLELVDAAGGIHKFLLAGIEGVTGIADTHNNHRLSGASLNDVAAGASDLRIHVLWMNFLFHKRPGKVASGEAKTSWNFWRSAFGLSFQAAFEFGSASPEPSTPSEFTQAAAHQESALRA
jgi:hypothetical protein